MHDSFDTTTTIVFALLAIVVIWKLRSVLGTRTGTERPPRDPFQRRPNGGDGSPDRAATKSEQGKIIRLPGPANASGGPPPGTSQPLQGAPPDPNRWKGLAEPDSKGWAGLDALRAADAAFDPAGFLEGAKAA